MSPRPRVVVAGGIGSGKSTVIGVLGELGWSILSADQVGHDVLMEPEVIDAVAARWPAAVFNRVVSRSKLAGIVFGDKSELNALEEITHPLIVGRIDRWVEGSSGPVALEVSVLKVVRPGWGPVVIVHAPFGLRRQRALERGMTAEDVKARMAAQPSDEELLAAADIVIDNQGTVDDLIAAVHRIDRWARLQ